MDPAAPTQYTFLFIYISLAANVAKMSVAQSVTASKGRMITAQLSVQ